MTWFLDGWRKFAQKSEGAKSTSDKKIPQLYGLRVFDGAIIKKRRYKMTRKNLITKLCCLLLAVTLLPIWASPTVAAQASRQATPVSAVLDEYVQNVEESYIITDLPSRTQDILWDFLGPTPTPTPTPASLPALIMDLDLTEHSAIMGDDLTPAISMDSIMEDSQSDIASETVLNPVLDIPHVSDTVFDAVLNPALDVPYVSDSVLDIVWNPALDIPNVEYNLSENNVNGTEIPMLVVCTPFDEQDLLDNIVFSTELPVVVPFAFDYEHLVICDCLIDLDYGYLIICDCRTDLHYQ